MPDSTPREERIRAMKGAFHYLMWVARRQLTQALQPFGLTFPQFIVLAALAAYQQTCSMRDLTNVIFEDPPTMTGIVDRLVKMGFVERSRSEQDRRVVLVQITPAGTDLIKKIDKEMIQDAMPWYADLSDEELALLEQMFRYKLRTYVGRFRSLQDDELDAEIQNLSNFGHDPIRFAKLESEEVS
jgi:DNA-binding MarR family transcriptional regulator